MLPQCFAGIAHPELLVRRQMIHDLYQDFIWEELPACRLTESTYF